MTLDLDNYSTLYKKYDTFVSMQPIKDLNYLISMFAVAFGCHVLVSALFYRRYFGLSDEWQHKFNSLTEFYHYVILENVDGFLNGEKL